MNCRHVWKPKEHFEQREESMLQSLRQEWNTRPLMRFLHLCTFAYERASEARRSLTMVLPAGLEPAAFGSEDRRSIQLS